MAQDSKTSNYSWEDVHVIADGLPVTDFAGGDDVVSIEFAEDAAESQVGAGGGVVISHKLNKSATITIKVLPSSPFIESAQEYTNTRKSFPFAVVELASGTRFNCGAAVIMNRPQRTFGAKAQESVEIKVFCGSLIAAPKGLPSSILS